MRVLVGLLILLLPGCTANVAELAQALGQDAASICGSTHVIYGIGNGHSMICRSNPKPGQSSVLHIRPDGTITIEVR